MTIRNADLAGKQHSTGVWFTKDGFPDFAEYCRSHHITGYVAKEFPDLTFNRKGDFAKANKSMGWEVTPKGWTWHHKEDLKTLELVPKDIHDKVGHTGSVKIANTIGKAASLNILEHLFGAAGVTLGTMFEFINPLGGLEMAPLINAPHWEDIDNGKYAPTNDELTPGDSNAGPSPDAEQEDPCPGIESTPPSTPSTPNPPSDPPVDNPGDILA